MRAVAPIHLICGKNNFVFTMDVCEHCFELRRMEDVWYKVCFQCVKTNNRMNNGDSKSCKEGADGRKCCITTSAHVKDSRIRR